MRTRQFKPTPYYSKGRAAALTQEYRSYRRSNQMKARRQAPDVVIYQQRAASLKGMDTEMELAVGNVLSTTNTNGAVFVVNLIRPGNGSWNRIGRKVKCKNLRIVGDITCTHVVGTTAANISGNIMRMVVVWDKQPSSDAIPTFDDIFGHTDQAGTETTDYTDPRKYDNMDRYRVLKDCIYVSNPESPTDNSESAGILLQKFYHVDEFIKLKVGETVYSGESTPQTIADISTGAIYVYFRAETNDSSASQWGTDLRSRLRYVDQV